MTIIPRWEWRTFGTQLGSPVAVFGKTPPVRTHESDEIYFLTVGGANVKVRDDLMDIKVLREVNDRGLEQWVPIVKTGFPVEATQLAEVFDALGIPAPALESEAYSLARFLEDLVEPNPEIQVVKVHKRRVRYALNGCMAEFTDVVANGRMTQTIAVESEDPGAVTATVHSIGFGNYFNTSYSAGLRATLNGTLRRFAVIDAGTNSIKFHLGERADDGSWTTIADRADVTRLGEDLDKEGVINPAAADRTGDAIAGMVDEAKTKGAVAVAAIGTAGLRMAKNRDAVIEMIRSRAGITVEVISGEEESRLAYVAVQASLDIGEGPLVVFDTGGGSSQFTFGTGPTVEDRFSVNVGAVRYTERFSLGDRVTPDVLADTLAAISADLSAIDDRAAPDAIVAMGGAVTNITAVSRSMAIYDPNLVQGTVLSRAEIDRQIDLYCSMDASDRRSIVGLQPKRADVILAGACIIRTVMDKLDQETITVSDRGLRHGLLVERFGQRSN